MPKKTCRYNNKHKYDTEEDQLKHEATCPDKKIRTDLKECPYSNRHIVTTKQYENHIKKCKFKPKIEKKDEPNKKNNNQNTPTSNQTNYVENNNDNNINQNDWNTDNWGDINETNENKNEDFKKNKTFNFDKADSNDIFEDEDFIFKECYI